MITHLDHIAIAVPDLQKAVSRFLEDFGLTFTGSEDVISAKTTTAFFPIEGTQIELVHPLNGEGPIAKYLEKNGKGGIHHICFRSDNILEDVAALTAKGYLFLSDVPGPGAHGCQVIFIHPKCCDGVLIEINQPADEHH